MIMNYEHKTKYDQQKIQDNGFHSGSGQQKDSIRTRKQVDGSYWKCSSSWTGYYSLGDNDVMKN